MAKRKGKPAKGASSSAVAAKRRRAAAARKGWETRRALEAARAAAAKKAVATRRRRARERKAEESRRRELELRRKREEAARKGIRRRQIREQARAVLQRMLDLKAEGASEEQWEKTLGKRTYEPTKLPWPKWQQAKWEIFEAYDQARDRYLEILEDIADACDTDWDIFYGPEAE